MDTIKRQVYFFQTAVMNGGFVDVLSQVQSLNGDAVFWEPESNKKIFCNMKDVGKGVVHGSLHEWRANDFPSVASTDDTVVRPLKLGKKEGLVTTTHFIYFPEKEILAMEYNFYGPRIGTLNKYINEKIDNVGVKNPLFLTFTALFNKDAVRQINRMGDITSVSIMVHKNHIQSIKNIDKTIFASLSAASGFGDLEEIELVLRPKKRGRSAILKGDERKSFLKRLKDYAQQNYPGNQFDRLNIKAWDSQTGKITEFDLLKDKMVYEVQTTKLNNARGVDPEDMFKNIQAAYKKKRADLLALVGN
jgi:hypothetical protein